MTLMGSVFTTDAGLPEADVVQVFVHMHKQWLKGTI